MDSQRILAAIEVIEAGGFFNIEGLQFKKLNGKLLVAGWSNYISIENINRNNALKELQTIKDIFHSILSESVKFKKYTSEFPIDYVLFCDDNGKTLVTVCEEIDNSIIWKI